MNNLYAALSIKLLLIISLVYITLIAVTSDNPSHSQHPDETVTKAAIEYYQTNFKIPDMRELPHDKFRAYGQTRLSELTMYYFLAGKLSALIPVKISYRFFNVLPAYLIVFIIIRNYKESPFLNL